MRPKGSGSKVPQISESIRAAAAEVETVLEAEAIAANAVTAETSAGGNSLGRIRELAKDHPELSVVAAFRLVELQLAEFASLAGVEEMLHADEAT